MPDERSPRRIRSEIRDRDQNRRRRLQDALPLESCDAKPESEDAGETSGRKVKKLGETTHPTTAPRSRSFSQRDDRDTAAQDSRRSGWRFTSEHGKWKDSRDEEQAIRRTTGSDLNEKREKPESRNGDSRFWRHDRFFEMDKNNDQPEKKRRQFREEKLPPESKPEGNSAVQPSKDAQHLNSTGGSDTRGERERIIRSSERSDFERTFVKARSFVNRERGERTDMLPRDRFSGRRGGERTDMLPRDRFNVSEYDDRYRGMDTSCGRQGFRSSGGRAERWKHDLYYEANTSPAKNEEDPVAKVEALLSL